MDSAGGGLVWVVDGVLAYWLPGQYMMGWQPAFPEHRRFGDIAGRVAEVVCIGMVLAV